MIEDQMAALMSAVPMPLVLIGPDGRVAALNPSAASIFGHAVTGLHYVTALRRPALLEAVENATNTGEAAAGRYLIHETSRDVAYRALAAPVRSGEFEGVMLSLENVGHLQAAGQMRRDFVANVSHELRTPLTALKGFIETLRNSARDDADARERFLGVMERETERMSRLVRDLLSLSRVESEEQVRPSGLIEISALLRSAVATLEPRAQEAGAILIIEGADDAVMAPGDADQIQQVFVNLIENAIKYGGSRIAIALFRQNHDPAMRGPAVIVEVRDDGDGIEPEHVPRLTERFYRVDGHRSREVGGTGLGLAIVKHVVGRHRGRLRVDSGLGEGSRFAIALPATEEAGALQGDASEAL